MRHFFGLVIAAGLVLGLASTADAQVAFSFGNPYLGSGISISVPGFGYYNGGGYYGTPYGYGYGSGYAPGYGYGSGYAPGYGYGSGYGLGGVGYGPRGLGYGYSSGYSGISAYAAPGTSYFGTGAYGLYPGLNAYGFPGTGYGGYNPVYGGGGSNYGYVSSGMFMGLPRPNGGLIRVPR